MHAVMLKPQHTFTNLLQILQSRPLYEYHFLLQVVTHRHWTHHWCGCSCVNIIARIMKKCLTSVVSECLSTYLLWPILAFFHIYLGRLLSPACKYKTNSINACSYSYVCSCVVAPNCKTIMTKQTQLQQGGLDYIHVSYILYYLQ